MTPRYVTGLMIAAVVVCAAPVASFAQDSSWAAKMVDHQGTLDFGTVARGADVARRVKIRNLYKETVQIAGVRTSCGCSSVKKSHDYLQAGEEGYVEIKMDTFRFMREKTSNAFVMLSIPGIGSQEVQIPLRVYIRTDVVLTPGILDFGVVDMGSPAERKISIAYAGRPDWTIREVRTLNPNLTGRVVETSRGNGLVNYDLVVNVRPDAPAGSIRSQMILVTDDANSPQVPVQVDGSVESDIVVTPPLLALGSLTPGQTKSANVVIRGRKPFTISKIECESDQATFKVQLPKEPKQVHVLPLTVTPPAQPGPINELFTVTIDGRPTPVTFKATGTVVAAPAPAAVSTTATP